RQKRANRFAYTEEGTMNTKEPIHQFDSARREPAPETYDAFIGFSDRVFIDGALSAKTKELIAVAVAHVTQSPPCIMAHTRHAVRQGATRSEIMEAIWIAAVMRAGAALQSA